MAPQNTSLIQNILVIGFFILGIWTTYLGLTFTFTSIQTILAAVLYLISINLLFILFFKNISSQVKIRTGSLMSYLSKTKYLRLLSIFLLNIFATVNFTYNWFHYAGAMVYISLQFAFAIILSFLAYLLYKRID